MKMVVFTTALIGLVGPALSMTSAQTDIKQFEWTTNLTFLAEEGHADALPRELHRTQINPIQKLLRRVKRAVEKRRPAAAARRAAPASGSDNTVKPKALKLKAKICRAGHKHCESYLKGEKLQDFGALAAYLQDFAKKQEDGEESEHELRHLAAFPLEGLLGIDRECCDKGDQEECTQREFVNWVNTLKKGSQSASVESAAWDDPEWIDDRGDRWAGTGDEAFTAWRDYAFCSACIRDVEGKKDNICGIKERSETMYVYRGLVRSIQKEEEKKEKEQSPLPVKN